MLCETLGASGQALADEQWWERGQADWYYKDDWKYEYVGSSPRLAVDLPEAPKVAWAQVWSNTAYDFRVNGQSVGKDTDAGTIENYEFARLLKPGPNQLELVTQCQQCIIEGGAMLASGKIVEFGTGRPRSQSQGQGSYTRTSGPTGYAGNTHMAQILTYTPEQQGKAAINDLLARMNGLQKRDGFLVWKLLDPVEMSLGGETLEEQVWSRVLQQIGELRSETRKLFPLQHQGQYESVLGAARKLDGRLRLVEATRDALFGMCELRDAVRALELQVPMLPGGKIPDVSARLRAGREAGRSIRALLEAGKVEAAAKQAREALAALAEARQSLEQAIGFPLDTLNRSSRNRLGWINSTLPLDNDPLFWEFCTIPSEAKYLALNGLWKFSLDFDEVGVEKGWHKAEFDDSQWKYIYAPIKWGYEREGYRQDNLRVMAGGSMAGHNPYNGASWYRRRLMVPAGWRGSDLKLILGGHNPVWVYVNGTLVNEQATAKEGSKAGEIRIPASAVRFGQMNTLAIRNYDPGGVGGLTSPSLALAPLGVGPAMFYSRVGMTTLRQSTYQIDGKPHRQRIVSSALSPGVIWSEPGGKLTLSGWSQRGYRPPKYVACAAAGAVQVLTLKPGQTTVIRPTPGRENWFLLWTTGTGRDVPRPLLVVLENSGKEVLLDTDSSGDLGVEFNTGDSLSRAMLVRPFDSLPAATLAPADADRCRLWARAGYPVAFAEVCWFEGQTCHVRQAVDFLNFGAQKDTPTRMAPLPMLFSYAQENRWPEAAVQGKPLNLGCKSHSGWYPNSDCGDYQVLLGTDRIEYAYHRREPHRRLMGVGEFINGLDFGQKEYPILRQWGMNSTRPAYHFDEKWEVPGFIQFDEKQVPVAQSGLVGGRVEFEPKIAARMRAKLERHAQHDITCILCWFSNDSAPYPKSGSEAFSTRTRRAYPESRHIPIDFWGQMAKTYGDLPADAFLYDFFNEPSFSQVDEYYPLIQDCVNAVRKWDKTHWVTVEAGNSWADIQECDTVIPIKDDKLIYEFHGYGPHAGDQFRNSLYYPGNYGSYDDWEERLLPPIRLQIRTGAEMLHGEFGITFMGPDRSPERWLDDVLAIHEKYRFGWNWWTWGGHDISRTGLWAGERVNPLTATMAKWAKRPAPAR